mgnify:CR=1 FL=1
MNDIIVSTKTITKNGVTFTFEKHSLLGKMCKVSNADDLLCVDYLDFDNDGALEIFMLTYICITKGYTLSPSYMPKMNKETIDKLADFDDLLRILNKYKG